MSIYEHEPARVNSFIIYAVSSMMCILISKIILLKLTEAKLLDALELSANCGWSIILFCGFKNHL